MTREFRRYLAEKFAKKRWMQMQPSFTWTGGVASPYYTPTPIGVYRKKKSYTRRGCCRRCNRMFKEWHKDKQRASWRREFHEILGTIPSLTS